MKLKTKIQLFSSLFMVILILIINTSVYFLFYKLSTDSELEELKDQTDTIVTSLNDNPSIAEDEFLKAFLPIDGMIRVIPEVGDPQVHSRDKAFFELPAEYHVGETQSIVTLENGEIFAVITKPIIWMNGEVVTLQVSKNLATLSENMRVLFYVLVLASLIILIPTVIAGNVLSRFLLKPIQALNRAMNENTRHAKWEKIDVDNQSKDELHELEKAYNNMIDKLKENYEKQEIFVSDASHELKTPISIVKSYADLIKRRGSENPELISESVEAISSEADRMQKLVEQMLSLAKNKEEAEMEQFNLASVCVDVTTAFKGAYDRTIELVRTDEKILIEGNMNQIKQVLYILVDNALKYSNDRVLVQLEKEQKMVKLMVTDFGPGIREEDKSRIFDRFYRVDKARSRDTGGTGLGLAIAKTIIESHKGSLTVESTIGEGSTFTICLPI
ncbi:HAMP domain-containing sensor histidine kinase [Ornithinibacillus halophilus]|uniref:Signal transduction histidine-protein kinase ArlS n=1 Tax=Ornithinibacillus halophilus TaxID=930117 RepID=A0A1M5IWI1_9BACI|nr:HAMP domain-containing sensor histidine kinase [Ornithinibacillus halophilus]SHG32611.1 Signal transduction histidine kinase [Ornithinibacillus halophilus]